MRNEILMQVHASVNGKEAIYQATRGISHGTRTKIRDNGHETVTARQQTQLAAKL